MVHVGKYATHWVLGYGKLGFACLMLGKSSKQNLPNGDCSWWWIPLVQSVKNPPTKQIQLKDVKRLHHLTCPCGFFMLSRWWLWRTPLEKNICSSNWIISPFGTPEKDPATRLWSEHTLRDSNPKVLYIITSKIKWDPTNGPLSNLLELVDTQSGLGVRSVVGPVGDFWNNLEALKP